MLWPHIFHANGKFQIVRILYGSMKRASLVLVSCCSWALVYDVSPTTTPGAKHFASSTCFVPPALITHRACRDATISTCRPSLGNLRMGGQVRKGGKVGTGADAMDIFDAVSTLKSDGLNVVPAKRSPTPPGKGKKKKSKPSGDRKPLSGSEKMPAFKGSPDVESDPPPAIAWSDAMRNVFWPRGVDADFPGMEWVENDQGFPLLQIEGLLSGAQLHDAITLANSLW